MDKQTVVYSYSRIEYYQQLKKKITKTERQTVDTWNNMGESEKHVRQNRSQEPGTMMCPFV